MANSRTGLPGSGFGTFWAGGRLSAMEQACLASIVQHGLKLTLFSYDLILNLPTGVAQESAEPIVARKMLPRIIFNGKPDLAHFSDLFRYEMISKRDLVWIDTDMLMIGGPSQMPHPDILVKEANGELNGAILYLSEKPVLQEVVREVEKKYDRELQWGETGPGLIKLVVDGREPPLATYDHHPFYPIAYPDIWKILLPEQFDECAAACKGATTLHLFNNIITTMGYWKELAPPEGSFLNHALAENGLLKFYKETYPTKVMTAVVENFRFRQNGKALGVKTLVRELVPSIRRTIQHYRK